MFIVEAMRVSKNQMMEEHQHLKGKQIKREPQKVQGKNRQGYGGKEEHFEEYVTIGVRCCRVFEKKED